MIERGQTLWAPDAEWLAGLRITDYRKWLASERDLHFANYAELWRWSVTELGAFWGSIWDYFGVVASTPPSETLAVEQMPGAVWFPGARLNWAQNLLRDRGDGDRVAVIGVDEMDNEAQLSWNELRQRVAALAAQLRSWGIGPGDRVVAYLPNCPETVIAVLAVASVGAVWSCCAPDFSPAAAADRLAPLSPRVLLVADGYRFGGREIMRAAENTALVQALPTVERVVAVRRLGHEALDALQGEPPAVASFEQIVSGTAEPVFAQLPFDHPLWVLFSSGTTGAPKGIVHSHGGILLESLKANGLHYDVHAGDRVLIAASTAWVVWNMLVDSLCVGATIVTYDGSPVYPDPGRTLELVDRYGVTRFGCGAAYLATCEHAKLRPNQRHHFEALRTIMTTGSPLPLQTWGWVYDSLKSDVMLGSDSGGTDVATGFIGSNPMLPVRAGVCQSAALGVLAQAWSPDGEPRVGELGELVITRPMPSMPIYFMDDSDGSKYHDAYFDMFPGIWRHGDWVTEDELGGFVVHGRSDATLNRGGVRMGSADIYTALADRPEVLDAMAVGVELEDGNYYMPLFVQLAPGTVLDDALIDSLRRTIREGASPRHVPDEIIAVPGVPLTRTGKKLEVAVKRLIQGSVAPDDLPLAGMQDASVMRWYADFADQFRSSRLGANAS